MTKSYGWGSGRERSMAFPYLGRPFSAKGDTFWTGYFFGFFFSLYLDYWRSLTIWRVITMTRRFIASLFLLVLLVGRRGGRARPFCVRVVMNGKR